VQPRDAPAHTVATLSSLPPSQYTLSSYILVQPPGTASPAPNKMPLPTLPYKRPFFQPTLSQQEIQVTAEAPCRARSRRAAPRRAARRVTGRTHPLRSRLVAQHSSGCRGGQSARRRDPVVVCSRLHAPRRAAPSPQEDLASIISNTKRKRRSPPPQANGNGKD
jgi:hypothetical protein